ncbi:hypothetical protein [Bacillus sonorensis]|uniref:hypothetical protein n=1 Tax=Bacillus sonorensis TaxID=119858 RepID=UPI00138832F3|nr:hypothetical protein [Bacillus sonorensis]TWK71849.1 hypothetical protein CHCC20335_2485 [Bacillus paralicheniformis]
MTAKKHLMELLEKKYCSLSIKKVDESWDIAGKPQKPVSEAGLLASTDGLLFILIFTQVPTLCEYI